MTAMGGRPGKGKAKDISLGASARRHPRIVLFTVAGLLALAVCAGLARTPTHTAAARLAVGGLNATDPTELTGFAAGAQQLAETYSRAVAGDAVVETVARQTGTTPSVVRSQLSVSPIPEAPVFEVQATSSSPHEAMELANLAGAALAADVNAARRSASARLLDEYRAAEFGSRRADKRLAALGRTDGPERVAAESEALLAASRANSLREAWGTSLKSDSVPLQVVQEADEAGSDRGSVMWLLAFIAVLAGLAGGVILAVLRDSPIYPKALEWWWALGDKRVGGGTYASRLRVGFGGGPAVVASAGCALIFGAWLLVGAAVDDSGRTQRGPFATAPAAGPDFLDRSGFGENQLAFVGEQVGQPPLDLTRPGGPRLAAPDGDASFDGAGGGASERGGDDVDGGAGSREGPPGGPGAEPPVGVHPPTTPGPSQNPDPDPSPSPGPSPGPGPSPNPTPGPTQSPAAEPSPPPRPPSPPPRPPAPAGGGLVEAIGNLLGLP